MQESYYSPSNTVLEESTPSKNPIDKFGTFNLSSAFESATTAFKPQWGIATLVCLVGLILIVLSAYSMIILVGIWAYPILFAGFSIHGLHTIRGDLTLSSIFEGFKKMKGSWLAVMSMGLFFSLPILPGLIALGAGLTSDFLINNLKEAGTGTIIGVVLLYIFIFINIPISMYLKGRLIIFLPLVLERDYTIREAMKKSFEITKNDQWWLMLFIFIVGIVEQAGFVLCFIGVFVSIAYGATLKGAAMAQLLGEKSPTDSQNTQTELQPNTHPKKTI